MNRREFTIERGVILGVNPRGLADRSVPILRIDGADGQAAGGRVRRGLPQHDARPAGLRNQRRLSPARPSG